MPPIIRRFPQAACLLLVTSVASPAADRASGAFTAFDSRLTARPVLRHDAQDGLQAFVPLRGGAAFLYSGRLVVEMGDEASALVLPAHTRTLLRLIDGTMWLAIDGRLLPLDDEGLDAARAIRVPADARLRASGTTSFLQANASEGNTRFDILTRTGNRSGLALIPGELRAFDWSPNGFAAVVGSAVFSAKLGARELTLLDQHPDYARATDALALPGGRVLLTVGRTVWLLDRGYRSIVVGMAAKLALTGDNVFFLDRASGVVWAAKGFGGIGPRTGDLDYAQRLRAEARQECRSGLPCPKEAEASRIASH